MNKNELFRLMDGEITDRVPVSFWHHFFDKEARERYENDPPLDEFFEFNRKWKEETQPDYVKIMTDFYRKPAIDIGSGTPKDVAALKIIRFPEFLEGSSKITVGIRKIYGDDTAVFMSVFSPGVILFDALKRIYKDEVYMKLAEMMRTNPEAMNEGIARLAEASCTLVENVVGPGKADGIYFASRMLRLPADLFVDSIGAADLRILDKAEALSPYNILHICDQDGKTADITVYKRYPCKVFHISWRGEELPLDKATELLGDRVMLGGFGMKTSDVLFTGPREAIEEETQKYLDLMKGKRFILGTDCTVPQKIDPTHLLWVAEYVRSHT